MTDNVLLFILSIQVSCVCYYNKFFHLYHDNNAVIYNIVIEKVQCVHFASSLLGFVFLCSVF